MKQIFPILKRWETKGRNLNIVRTQPTESYHKGVKMFNQISFSPILGLPLFSH